ncbi:MAG: 4-amino-4-deoxy-L-arabinose-phospho-UDP flippase [Pseudomonadota bacterium]
MVLFIACGQILFKITAERISGEPITSIISDWRTIVIFGIALGIYGVATIMWVLALRELALSQAYMLMSLSFVIVPVAAMVLFGEKLSTGFFLGSALIISGLIVTLGSRP